MAAAVEQQSPSIKLLFREAMEEMRRRGLTTGHADFTTLGPQTDEELWQAIYELTHYRIPRVAVCEGHHAPFDTFADLYFERLTDVLWIGNRGGGKTTNSGFLHGAKDRWKPGYKTAIAGAIKKQSDRAYKEFKRFCRHIITEIVDEEIKKESVEWLNASETELLAGTESGVNGPHPHLAQFDEVELIQSLGVFEEWLNMSQGDELYDGQNLLTSTRKRAYGLVQAIVKECEEAIRNGDSPPWDIRIFCIWETLANVPECGVPNADGTLKCGCDRVVKGTWPAKVEGETPKPRAFADVCKGRAGRAGGFVKLKDAHRRFKSLGRRVWEAQQECLRPSSEGLVHEWWDPLLYDLPYWYPRPEYGPIFRSWDWGGTNPHSVHWQQVLKVDVRLEIEPGTTIVVPEGATVTFDEVFHSGGGAFSLGLEVFERTQVWADHGFRFDVEFDFCDPANPTARADVKRAAHDGGYPEPNFRAIPATVETSVEKHIEIGEEGKIRVVGRMCPNLVEEYEEYHWPEQKPGQPAPKKPVQVDDHAVDDQRYHFWNYTRLQQRQTGGAEGPVSDFSEHSPRSQAQEQQARGEALRTFGAQSPVASSMSPAYARSSPTVTAPTVRRHGVQTIRQAPGMAYTR